MRLIKRITLAITIIIVCIFLSYTIIGHQDFNDLKKFIKRNTSFYKCEDITNKIISNNTGFMECSNKNSFIKIKYIKLCKGIGIEKGTIIDINISKKESYGHNRTYGIGIKSINGGENYIGYIDRLNDIRFQHNKYVWFQYIIYRDIFFSGLNKPFNYFIKGNTLSLELKNLFFGRDFKCDDNLKINIDNFSST